MNPLNPKKLLLTKWTAVKPVAKQKHFLVSRVIQPALPTDPIEQVEIEAVFSKATQVIAWRDLQEACAASLGNQKPSWLQQPPDRHLLPRLDLPSQ
jgi:hypothetical protein